MPWTGDLPLPTHAVSHCGCQPQAFPSGTGLLPHWPAAFPDSCTSQSLESSSRLRCPNQSQKHPGWGPTSCTPRAAEHSLATRSRGVKSKLWKLPLILLLTGKQLPAVYSLKNLTQRTEQDRADSARWCLVTSLCPNFLFCSFFFQTHSNPSASAYQVLGL